MKTEFFHPIDDAAYRADAAISREDGWFKIHGRDEYEVQAEKLKADARAVAEAGAFALVIEGTVESVARTITSALAIPTIGIGASMACDGQILVSNDLLGFAPKPPRFAKRFVDLASIISKAVEAHASEVRERRLPGPEHCFGEKK